MRNGLLVLTIFISSTGILPQGLAAQSRTELHLHAGAALPRGDWSDQTATGWGYGANIVVRPITYVGFYGGWDRFHFEMDTAQFPDIDGLRFVDTGFRLGLEFRAPLPYASPFAFGGVTLGEGNLEVRETDVTTRVGRGTAVGYEAGFGLDIPLGLVNLRPRVGYRSRDSDIGDVINPFGSANISTDQINISLGVAFVP